MSTVILEIPAEYARSFGATDEEAKRNASVELAVQMYREGRWSTKRAGDFAGMNRWQFMELLKARGIEAPYSRKMLDQDLRYGFGSL